LIRPGRYAPEPSQVGQARRRVEPREFRIGIGKLAAALGTGESHVEPQALVLRAIFGQQDDGGCP
jgi:hypothetical protein